MLNTLIPTISKKVLTNQLKELENDGLLLRQSFAEIPPRVEYSLTEKAVGLLPVLRMLSDWANEAYPEMEFEQCRIIENGKASVQQRVYNSDLSDKVKVKYKTKVSAKPKGE